MEVQLNKAHAHSSKHREELQASQACGCFFCQEIFSPERIEEWCDKGQTAICPSCGIDAVIGSESGFPITKAFLGRMHEFWF